MAFTWKPLESHRAHTLSTSLWPGMEIAAMLFPTTRAVKRGHYRGMRQEHQATTGSLWSVGDCGLWLDNRAKMNSIPAISHFHTQTAALFVLSLSMFHKFSSQKVGWKQTSTQTRQCSLAAWRSPRFQPPTPLYQEKITLTPEKIN